MSMFGGGFGGPGGGTGGPAGGGLGGVNANRPGGGALPFAGIPEELLAGVQRLEASEPEHSAPEVRFTHRAVDAPPLTLGGIVGRYRGILVLACLLVVAETLSLQAGPYLVQIGIDHGVVAHNLPVLLVATAVFAGSVVLGGLASAARIRATGRLAAYATSDLRIRVFAHLQRLSMDYFTREKAGVTLTRMTSDIESVQQLLQDGLAQFAVQGLTMVVITVVLFSYDVELALITLLLVVPALAVASVWFRIASDRGYRRQRDTIAALYSELAESLHGVRVVIAHNRQERNIVAHQAVVGRYRDANDYTGHINAIYGPGTSAIGLLGMAVLLLVGGRMVLRGELRIGELTAFVLYLNAFFQPVQQLVQLYNSYQQSRAAVAKLRELLLTEPTVPEAPDAIALPPVRGEIRFDHVTFGYEQDRPVLRDVSVRIAPGETVACVGPTGAGKSTLAKLVTRLHDPDRGQVLIDGYDLRTVTLASLRRQIAVVPQEPFLFAGTIRDNVAFARPDADDEQVWAAIDAVGLRELVERSSAGLHTRLHERGQSVSSGERQLLALARAFLAQPRVVILDEATSSLDLQSELRVEAALDTLLAAGGRYAGMYQTWSSGRVGEPH